MKKIDTRHIPAYSVLAESVVQGGTYKHYKGSYYIMLKIARSSETLEELVVYQALYGDCLVWVRPLSMFLEMVEVNGITQPRFELLIID